ncbi:Putative vacuolar protein sorting-associated protein TDA6 [Fulvia fulva]|uniref:Vacuolar protein sorting-associated protein TDA6 n=1 Tax=Passalora fulva TaxID=5499 RepID=A0A9Q8UWI3_PASFU|nr:Putative vacuolar protein sorting-associated protein TDA6 [Fulvia fulva]KAK4609399.1 putative vacuolar protein sorting-associated protein TDA6 [Fulvia fulva]KAK4609904.1 putative vacuolar protein sorting-associated protein TDA6 [Fulvia fulva]UJO25046.1 Putative vacuolar protein sorting-associated protein TDA6 [Fulvia fulva]WPV22583.1 Putative vacuolar protein sorting-associated protein TDA6 [Fulvia fulva]WPV37667.1 Putative vacuolar protein sorting-associated protein TDA6 [Fulvia fulva]
MLSLALLSLALTATAAPLEPRQAPSNVPDFVVKFAPIAYLHTEEKYNPSDISTQLFNTHPAINRTTTTAGPNPLTLDNLNNLNTIANSGSPGGEDIFLTSNADPTTDPRPEYLYGVLPDAQGKTNGATSSAVITVQKGGGILDAFYFYFYAFDFGGVYFGLNVGNHVGDWEHTMVRFVAGVPQAIWYSQHSRGQAFTYQATKKGADGVRPLVYVANGTHANYATDGNHDHTIPGVNLPFGPIEDHTDAGALWDPIASAYYYSYDVSSKSFAPYNDEPTNWLYFTGHWGDAKIPEDDERQKCAFGIDALCEYVGGPTGPAFKGLDRKDVCPDGVEGGCHILPFALAKRDKEVWDDMSL